MTQEKKVAESTKDLVILDQLSQEQKDLIKNTVAVGATDLELRLFLYTAHRRGLDPLTGQIHFIKRKRFNPDTEKTEEVGTIQTGIDGFRVIANRTGKLAGIKREAIYDEGNLIGARATVWRKDWQYPVIEEVAFEEYCQKRKDGKPTRMWATMPETMIKKVAEAVALRLAFPEDLSGLYSNEEMEQADNEPTKTTILTSPKLVHSVEQVAKEMAEATTSTPGESTTEAGEVKSGDTLLATENKALPRKLPRDPVTIKSIGELRQALLDDFGIKPAEQLAELGLNKWIELDESPSEAYIRVAVTRPL